MVLTLIASFVLPFSTMLFADDDKHENKYLPPVDNEVYKQQCGACHFSYQPGLLPFAAWANILDNLPAHFGQEIALAPETKDIIRNYVESISAEKSSAKRSKKIMRSLGKQVPLRITEVPYILEKHDDLDPNIFSRPSVGSFSNCIACHTKAVQGDYDDDYVRIPN